MPQAKTFDLGLEFIEANAAADEWFLQIETFDPHEPFFSQPEFRAMSAAARRPLAPPPLSATLERHAATGPVPSLLPWPLPPVATLHAHTHHNTPHTFPAGPRYPHSYSGPEFDWPPYREIKEDGGLQPQSLWRIPTAAVS